MNNKWLNQIKQNKPQKSRELFTIPEIYELKKNKKLFFNMNYQRKSVWNDADRQDLMNSIIHGIPVPEIILRKIGGKFEVIDGRQRIETIEKLYDNKLNLSLQIPQEMGGGKKFKNVHQDLKEWISRQTIGYLLIETPDDEIINETFLAVQKGRQLTIGETLHGIQGKPKETVKKMVKQTNIKKYIKTNRSNEYRTLISCMLCTDEINPLNSSDLIYYARNTTEIPEDKIKDLLNTMCAVCGKVEKIKNLSNTRAVLIYCLINELLKQGYEIKSNKESKKINNFIHAFFNNITACKKYYDANKDEQTSPEVIHYVECHRVNSTKAAEIQQTLKFMLNQYNKYVNGEFNNYSYKFMGE